MSGLMTRPFRRHVAITQVATIPGFLMTAVQDVLSMAWRMLLEEVRQGSFSICSATEDAITERLHMILGELSAEGDSAVQGLSNLQTPGREEKIRNFNGNQLDKQPDLTFRPIRGLVATGNMVTTGIFIECKPVDSKHPIPGTYCRKGLIRFVNGDYAWMVDRALMVGYVRNVCSLPDGLSSALSKPALCTQMQMLGSVAMLPSTASGDPVCQTTHTRTFGLQGSTTPVGQISVNHLWLHPAAPCEASRCRDNSIN